MSIISNDQLLQQLNWRYATKFFDATKKIPQDVWNTIENALVLSPSSYGLQPWKFFVINDGETRKRLLPFTWGQKQVVDASHYIVLAIKKDLSEVDVDKFINRIVEVRGGSFEILKPYRNIIVGDLVKGPRNKVINEWAARQVYIALGNLMTSAALLGVDACPIEGFVPVEYDKILGLPEMGYNAVVCCALGYRSESDKYASAPKVRFEKQDVISTI
ncbi:MAG: NAD(P)H-dependent oxidoreductase [Elusimicrobiota bacterium]